MEDSSERDGAGERRWSQGTGCWGAAPGRFLLGVCIPGPALCGPVALLFKHSTGDTGIRGLKFHTMSCDISTTYLYLCNILDKNNIYNKTKNRNRNK